MCALDILLFKFIIILFVRVTKIKAPKQVSWHQCRGTRCPWDAASAGSYTPGVRELGWTGVGCCCHYDASVDTNTSLKTAPPGKVSQVVLVVKNPVQSKKAMQEMQKMWVQSLGLEDPLEKETAIPFSILSWKISCTEEPSELQSMGPQRVRHDWANEHTPGKVYQLLYFVIIWGLRSWGGKRIYLEKANLGLFHVASGHNSKCEKVKNHIMIMASYVQMHTFYWFYSIIVIITLSADLLILSPKTLLSCRNPNNILDLFL